jgi:hypothetical protein
VKKNIYDVASCIALIMSLLSIGCGSMQLDAGHSDEISASKQESPQIENSKTAKPIVKIRDAVYLKNGSVLKGTIHEMTPETGVKIELSEGSFLVHPMSEILRVTKDTVRADDTKPMTTLAQKDLSQPIITIGLLQGGSLIGADLEMRLNKVIGLQIGGGLLGVAGAINFHLNPSVEGGYLSANIKGIGITALIVGGLEYGHRFAFNPGLGLGIQIGIGSVISRDSNFDSALGSGSIVLTYGIGLYF